MKTRWIAFTAIALWAITIASVIVMIIRGQTVPSTDGRTAVQLAPTERDLVLADMRIMLRSVQGVVLGLARGEAGKAAAAARSSGVAMGETRPLMAVKFPMAFRQMSVSVHQGFDRLAADAEAGVPPAKLYEALGTLVGTCLACHEAYRLQ